MKSFFQNNKKIILAAAIVAAFIIAAILGNLIHTSLTSYEVKVSQAENGRVQIDASINQLKEKNIEYGDSVKMVFSSYYVAENVPILNGEFLNTGQHIATAVDEASPITFYIQGSTGFWDIASLKDDSSVKIYLTEKGKYKNLFNAFNMPITGDVKNLRSLRGGNLKLLDLFRGINPNTDIDIKGTMNYYFHNLSIENIINLNQNQYNITSFDIKSKECNQMLITRLLEICQLSGRTYICSDSQDMTGYFSAIIEALSGATYDEIVNDYMETYKNLYGITLENNPDEYNAIKTYHIDWFLHKFTKTPKNKDLHGTDFAYDAEMYLRANGVTTENIKLIQNRLTN